MLIGFDPTKAPHRADDLVFGLVTDRMDRQLFVVDDGLEPGRSADPADQAPQEKLIGSCWKVVALGSTPSGTLPANEVFIMETKRRRPEQELPSQNQASARNRRMPQSS